MPSMASSPLLTPAAFWRWGRVCLVGGLALGLLAVVYLAWNAPSALPLLPVVLLGGVTVWYLFRHPLLNLAVVLCGFVLIVGYSDGLQAEEVLYGLYFLSFLAYWYISRLFLYRDRLTNTPEDRALFFFLIYVAFSASWAWLLFGATPRDILGEATVLAMLAFYFPVKEVCSQHPRNARIVLIVIGWLALFVLVRNLLIYQSALTDATQLWQIISERIALNEALLMMPALGALVLLLYAKHWRSRLLLAVLFSLLSIGLILTQSRGYWAAFALGVGTLFLLTDRRHKMRILMTGTFGLGCFLIVGMLFLQDFMILVLTGLVDRIVSLGSAFTRDISLINRFYESSAVWSYIKQNPILGYGIGAHYRVFDMIRDVTMTKPFIHNGYVGMWFKYGLIGLGFLLFFWGRIIWLGIRLFHMKSAPSLLRLIGLMAALALISEALVANTSTPFQITDATLMFGLLGGLVSGSLAYIRRTACVPT